MATITQPLREEHKELLPHIDSLRTAADLVSEELTAEALQAIREAHDFLRFHLIPHAEAEEAALYPTVQKAMGATLATGTMSRDHVEVGRLVRELDLLAGQIAPGKITPVQAKNLRRVLYGLYTLVGVHFAKEEEVYLPLLDERLSPEEGQAMFAAMEAAAGKAKAAHAH